MNLSPHFSLRELTVTQVRDVSNEPGPAAIDNLTTLATGTLELIRARWGAMFTHSGFRSDNTNRIIGGSPTSSHRCIGKRAAWDGHFKAPGVTFAMVIDWLQHDPEGQKVPVDQVIYEALNDKHWLHVGIDAPNRLRRQFLMTFKSGPYETWNPADPRITF